jgi:hypothetical protein
LVGETEVLGEFQRDLARARTPAAAVGNRPLYHMSYDTFLCKAWFWYAGFEIFTVVTVKNYVFLDMAPSNNFLACVFFFALNVEATCCSETSVLTRSTRCHIPEEIHFGSGSLQKSQSERPYCFSHALPSTARTMELWVRIPLTACNCVWIPSAFTLSRKLKER